MVKYKNFKSSEPYEITFHPYYLKQFNSRWFAFGLNEDNKAPRWNLALDRIESFYETNLKLKPSETDWEEYFYDLVGVTRPENTSIQEIILKFSPDVAPYILTKPLHPSQKHTKDPTGLEVRIQVIPNFELEKLVLSFGEQVKVISPLEFKDRISQRLRSANSQY
ncbi:MAG: WYL domain-containing protein [Cyclobacteriaceae bacterium]